MDGFSFPPPPPPPPKATSSLQQEAPTQFNNRGVRGGRGGRGNRGSFRSRGGAPQRGGSNFQHQTNNTGYGQNTSNYQNYGNQQQQYQAPQQHQRVPQYQGQQQYQSSQQYQAPPGSYVNPAFGGHQAQVYPQTQHAQYAQQNAYPTGQNSQPTYGNPSNAKFSPGGKRTRDQAFGTSHRGHPMKKPASASKAQVAPAVPSFGTPILPQKPPALITSNGGLKQRPSANLGLIPQTYTSPSTSDIGDNIDDDEEEEEEEVDEEATLSALKDGPLSFEFNGELSTLSSSTEIAEWLDQRKKRWPSKRRIEEKEKQVQLRMEERKRIEQETRMAIARASGEGHQREDRQTRKPTTERLTIHKDDSALLDAQKELAIQMQKVEELQRLLAEKENTQTDQATAMQETNHPQATDPTLDNPNPQPSDQTQQNQDSDSSDSGPEQASSKPTQPIRIPPPTSTSKHQQQQQPQNQKQCIAFLNQGKCKFGNKCRYKHDAMNQEKGKRKSLYQKLVEQEMEGENLLALQAIKYLGGVGFFSKHATSKV